MLPHINQDLGNFSQWIEGAYIPSSPCLYCLQHRLQCLVLRTDPVNPNPVTSCASCVALFRECSMAQGSKRLPSEFETTIPVMGQLHGVIEESGERIAGWGGTGEPANTRKQISRRSIRPLKDWLSAHQDDPFPSHEEKLLLELQSGLTKVQISNWFANARRRQKGITVTMPPLPIIRNRQLSDTDGRLLAMNPMERWANSPPESEPAQSSMVAKAAGSLPLANSQGLEYGSYILPYSGASGPATSSVKSFGTDSSDNSNNSSMSAWSEASHYSFKKRKQRARRRSARPKTKINATEDNGCVYECTFCSESFSLRYDWQRHEQSIHLPMERWICSPDSLLVPLPINGNSLVCMFCQESSPTAEHLATHDAEACLERPPEGRTFTRKDHLRQHLRKYHGCQSPSSLDWILDSWKVENMNFRSRCGFCGTWFSAWKQRSAHLASHFQRGARMSEWSGDHGFDEESQRLLTNATHPNIVKQQKVG
ncbi:hypothetical protein B0O99DRAFT_530038 [Bisporella sp. PMI_857]|nr:hypothetical protein B0O99DRAFT_530038 [Bisporella sp. PMI_857]